MLLQHGQTTIDHQGQMPARVGFLAPVLSKLLDDAHNAVDSDVGTARACLVQALALLRVEGEPADDQSTRPARRGGFASWQEQRVRKHIEAHLDEPIRVADLAELSGLSVSYFSVAFRQSFGVSPQTFLLQRRVDRAKSLMLSTGQTLADIALASGFCDQAHFCRRFRRVAGSTPNAWRRQYRRAPLGN